MMSNTLAKLLCVAALSVLAMPVSAADPKSTDQGAQGTTNPTGAAGTSAISPEEKSARAACESKPAAERDKCLKDVDAKYGKASTDKMSPPSGDTGMKPKEDATKSGSYK
jgi:hypothetical protein